jgi:hypothetical protein
MIECNEYKTTLHIETAKLFEELPLDMELK